MVYGTTDSTIALLVKYTNVPSIGCYLCLFPGRNRNEIECQLKSKRWQELQAAHMLFWFWFLFFFFLELQSVSTVIIVVALHAVNIYSNVYQ